MKPNMNSSAGNLLSIINEEIQRQLNGGRRKRKPKEHVLGTITDDYVNDSSRPFVIVDGDPIPIGPFNYLNTYQPSAGDRVLMAKSGRKYVILGKIGIAGEVVSPSGDYAPANHNHDSRYYTEAEIDARNKLAVYDSRNIVPTPSDYSKEMQLEFKLNSVLGITDMGESFSFVITLAQWADDSGGGVHQIVHATNGKTYKRYGTRANGWGPWSNQLIVPTLLNGWSNYETESGTYELAGYIKDSEGFVHLKGLVKGGVVGFNEEPLVHEIFTLDVGCRPRKRLLFSVSTDGGMGRIDVGNNGAVQVITGGNGFVSLNGLSFRAEQ